MKPEEQRIKIAEALGWERVHIGDAKSDAMLPPDGLPEPARGFRETLLGCKGLFNEPIGVILTRDGESFDETMSRHGMPDFLHDLNAIHAAEETLDADQHEVFRMMLNYVISTGAGGTMRDFERAYASATAEDRAEAFLRATGLWDDYGPKATHPNIPNPPPSSPQPAEGA